MKSDQSRKIGLILILAVALINFFLGSYHLTTRIGWRSGFTELVSASLLVVAIYLFSRPEKS